MSRKVRDQVVEATSAYDKTLVAENGIRTLIAIIGAQEEWRQLTLKQRQYLMEPSRSAHKRTVQSLFEKGLLMMSSPGSFPLSDYGAFVVRVRHQK